MNSSHITRVEGTIGYRWGGGREGRSLLDAHINGYGLRTKESIVYIVP